MAASAAVVAGLIGGVALALDEPHRAAPPADHAPVENSIRGPVENGPLVGAVDGGPGGSGPSDVEALPDPGAAPYPVWQDFDQDTGRFPLHQRRRPPASLPTVTSLPFAWSRPARTIPWRRSAVTRSATH